MNDVIWRKLFFYLHFKRSSDNILKFKLLYFIFRYSYKRLFLLDKK